MISRLRREAERGLGLLAQRLDLRADIAVTGLRRSGKSVFIASLIHNLTGAAHDPSILPALRAGLQGRLIAAAERPPVGGGVAVFPTQDYLRAMAGERPAWPAPTAAVSRTEIVIRYKREGLLSYVSPDATIEIGIVDYPGEWLLDLPLLTQSYAEWSAATLNLLRGAPRREAAREFLAFIGALDPFAPADEARLTQALGLYRAFLTTCRETLGLSFLQPGRHVLPDDEGDRPALWFVPLDLAGMLPPRGSLAARCAERFDRYRDEIARPFFEATFDATNRQVLLFDLIATLNAGHAAFEDAAMALDAVSRVLLRRREGPLGLLFPKRFDRVLFAATKADFVPDSQRERLKQLLHSLVIPEETAARMAGAEARAMAVSAARCTRDERVSLDIGEVEVVVGVPVEGDKRVKVYSGILPKEPPPASFWEGRTVRYPVFRPPSFNARPGHGVPHINMDAALEFLIGDLLT